MLYLGLAGVYLPFSLHSQTSLLYRAHNANHPSLYGPTTLSGTTTRWRSKRQLIHKRTPAYDTLLRSSQTGGFVDGLFPLHSPLLRESQLFSFPPRTKMFPFSGFPFPKEYPINWIGSPIRRPLDLRLHASPQGISLLVTPFFGSLG